MNIAIDFNNKTAAFIIPMDADRFACILDDVKIGTSKDPEYFEYHYKRGDVKALKSHVIKQFIYTTPEGKVTQVIDPNQSIAERMKELAEQTAMEHQAHVAVEVLQKVNAEEKAVKDEEALRATQRLAKLNSQSNIVPPQVTLDPFGYSVS